MLKWLLDMDGNTIDIESCRNGALDDYYPRAYINLCIRERAWHGIPSTTQLINGTRQEYLQHFVDYALDPDKCAYRIAGTKAHSRLADLTPLKDLPELSIPNDDITMIADLLEIFDDNKANLVDYKLWGSFKAAQAIGLKKYKRLMVDGEGNPVRYKKKCGKYQRGDMRTESYFLRDPAAAFLPEATWQLNKYRMLIEDYFGINIIKMRLFIIVRDGGLLVAKQRGIERNTYYPEIERIPDSTVNSYFERKRSALLNAIDGYESDYIANAVIDKNLPLDFNLLKKHCPPLCDKIESWDTRKCQGYCPVSDTCLKIYKTQEGIDEI